MTRKGWVREPARHSLAAKGIKTVRKIKRAIPLKMKTIKEAEEEIQRKRDFEDYDLIESRYDHDDPDSDASIDEEYRHESYDFRGYIDDMFHEFSEYDVKFEDWVKTLEPDVQKSMANYKDEFKRRKKDQDIDYQRTHPPIQTVAGPAHYVKTEIADKNGRWNDDYYTKDGYWVVHKGIRHHVYKVK